MLNLIALINYAGTGAMVGWFADVAGVTSLDPVSLITGGGAIGTLAGLVVLLLHGDLVTGKAADRRVEETKASMLQLVTEITTSRDEWKSIAKDAITDVGQLGEALTVRNRIDEALTKKVDELTKATA